MNETAIKRPKFARNAVITLCMRICVAEGDERRTTGFPREAPRVILNRRMRSAARKVIAGWRERARDERSDRGGGEVEDKLTRLRFRGEAERLTTAVVGV